jgi:hypothetical protein
MHDDRRLDWRTFLPVGMRGWLWRAAGFTAAEVERLLREDPPGPRARAVWSCLARPQDWLPDPDIARCPVHYHRHLTRILFWFARGDSIQGICLRLGGAETNWGVERALAAACGRIAACLDAAPQEYDL